MSKSILKTKDLKALRRLTFGGTQKIVTAEALQQQLNDHIELDKPLELDCQSIEKADFTFYQLLFALLLARAKSDRATHIKANDRFESDWRTLGFDAHFAWQDDGLINALNHEAPG